MAFKPLKMGLRMAHLADSWENFERKYRRIVTTYEELFRIQLTEEELSTDFEYLKQLQTIVNEHKLVTDTVLLLNQKMNEGKRILVEDCSSSSMDMDHGIYPYVDSFYTTTGQVCSGLGVPEEAVETTIGVISSLTLIRQAFLNRVRTFPTQIKEGDPEYEGFKKNLAEKYSITEDKYAFGWLDLNLVNHAQMINGLSSLYLTGLDILDDLDEIKVCKKYKVGDSVLEHGFPALIDDLGILAPEYKSFTGWKKDITEIETFDQLPVNTQTLIRGIEKATKLEVSYVDVCNDEEEGLLRIVR